jgi:hypothetical protein
MAIEISILILLLSVSLLIIGYELLSRNKTNRDKQQASHISKLIISYFGNTDLEVRVFTFKPDWHENFMTLIETPPINRFRHSNILEGSLIEYIENITGQTIAKVFWRFSLDVNLAKAESFSSYSHINQNKGQESDELEEIGMLDESGNPHINTIYYEVSEISVEEFNEYAPLGDLTNVQETNLTSAELLQPQLETNSIRKTS